MQWPRVCEDFIWTNIQSSEDLIVGGGLILLLGVFLTLMQLPQFWVRERLSQRSMQITVLGVVIALSSSLANIVQYKLDMVFRDPYLGLLIGSAASGLLVAVVEGFTEMAKNKFLLACLIGSILVCGFVLVV